MRSSCGTWKSSPRRWKKTEEARVRVEEILLEKNSFAETAVFNFRDEIFRSIWK